MVAAAQFRTCKPYLIAFAPSPIRAAADSEDCIDFVASMGHLGVALEAKSNNGPMHLHARLLGAQSCLLFQNQSCLYPARNRSAGQGVLGSQIKTSPMILSYIVLPRLFDIDSV